MNPVDSDSILGPIAAWIALNSAIPVAGIFTARRKKATFATGVFLSALAAGWVAWKGGVMAEDARWLFGLLFGAAVLPALLLVFVLGWWKSLRVVHPLGSLLMLALIGGATALAALKYGGSEVSRPDHWTTPGADARTQIAGAIASAAEADFRVAAVNGKITLAPQSQDPVSRLALWIFSQRAGLALQPGVRVAGVMTSSFVPTGSSVEVVPTPDAQGRLICRAITSAELTYRIRWIAPDKTQSVPDRIWSERTTFRMEGLFQPASGSVHLTLAEPIAGDTQ